MGRAEKRAAKNAKQPKRAQKDINKKHESDAEIMRKKQEKANLKKMQNGGGGDDKNKKKKKNAYVGNKGKAKPKDSVAARKNAKKKLHGHKKWKRARSRSLFSYVHGFW